MLPVLVNETIGEVTPHLSSFPWVELEDLKEVVHQVGVGEEEEEDDLDDGETDDEEWRRPL